VHTRGHRARAAGNRERRAGRFSSIGGEDSPGSAALGRSDGTGARTAPGGGVGRRVAVAHSPAAHSGVTDTAP
jgi:hypothetical protein